MYINRRKIGYVGIILVVLFVGIMIATILYTQIKEQVGLAVHENIALSHGMTVEEYNESQQRFMLRQALADETEEY